LPEPAPRQTIAPPKGGPGGWTANGGTVVVLGQGETLNTVANRYGVPASAILEASGLSKAAQATPGKRLVIPVYNAGGTQVAAESRAPREPARSASDDRRTQTARLETFSAPRRPEPLETKPEVQQKAVPAPRQEAARKEPEETASIPSGGTDFRWPVRGRVISGFGGPSGNEGINIAVPEGAPVKATESGTVAYAGSEVKGYGNLVLIRHDNGFVSAYAHNSEISVKRGDKVRRGQVIAKAGQTGNVTSPQLHFEIRKGSTPVDPMPHLEK
jgi:murein DD-endopeptidase MepM/ murein hydrolase activator NlpD